MTCGTMFMTINGKRLSVNDCEYYFYVKEQIIRLLLIYNKKLNKNVSKIIIFCFIII